MVSFFLQGGVQPILTISISIYNKVWLQQQMNNQKVLQLHPHLSKLIDSLCFELALNVPDENSLSLLQIISMRRNSQINDEQLVQLYKGWLESKNVFDLFTAKQVKIYPKHQLISDKSIAQHLHIHSINSSLQILDHLYNTLLISRKKDSTLQTKIKETQDLFSYLDCEGNIHLRLSQLFFLHLSVDIYEKTPIVNNYQSFKPIFKIRNKELCEVEGMVSLRSFKNNFIMMTNYSQTANQLLNILKQIQRTINNANKSSQNRLPNILQQAFKRWRMTSRFTGLFQSKKKKLQIYHRIFEENEEIFFFNGKDDTVLSQAYFIKKYGESYIRSLQIDTNLLRQFDTLVKQTLNQYLILLSRTQSQSSNKQNNHSNLTSSNANRRNSNMHMSTIQNPSPSLNSSALYSQKLNQSYQLSKSKEKTPSKIKGNETNRLNITPTNKSVSVQRQMFESTQRSQSKKNDLTPTKTSHNISYNNARSVYMGNQTQQQVFRNSKKQGLQEGSFYQKLFFFRNKRVQSFDIVIKRLKGR